MVDVSAEAERTFVRLLGHLDDEGRTIDNPKLLKAAMYPLHDQITTEDVDGWLWELAGYGLVIRYETDGKRYVSAKPDSWARWQKPRWKYASKFPPPNEGISVEMPSTSDARPTNVRRTSAQVVVELRGDGEGAAASTSDARPTNVRPHPTLERQRLFDEAVKVLTDRHLARVDSHGNPKRHRAAVFTGKQQDHREEAFSIIDDTPNLTPEQLADRLEPPPKVPVDTTRRDYAHVRPDCPEAPAGCGGSGMILAYDGSAQRCPMCNPVQARA